MAQDIYVETGAISSRLIRDTQNELAHASDKLTSIKDLPNATYQGPEGYCKNLFPSYISEKVFLIATQIAALEYRLDDYARIMQSAPEELADVDGKRKNDRTTWWERTRYSNGFFSGMVTGTETVINYWKDNYQSHGWTYKTVQTAVAVGKAVPAVVGCFASWVFTIGTGGAGAPVAVLGSIYLGNTVHSTVSDICNLWITEDYNQVGNTNWLKDTLAKGYGDLSEMVSGDRNIGELVGNGVYGAGDVFTSVVNAKNIDTYKGVTPKSTYLDDMRSEFASKIGIGSGGIDSLRSKVIQSDVNFNIVTDAVKEIPSAVKGIVDIATKSDIVAIAKDYKLLSYEIPNVIKVVGMTQLLEDIADTTADVLGTGIAFNND